MPPACLPLLGGSDAGRVLAWRAGRALGVREFLAHVRQVAEMLPVRPAAVNLCVDRYAFTVAFCAAMLRGQVTLLPPSRAPRAVEEVMTLHAGAYALGEEEAPPGLAGYWRLPALGWAPPLAAGDGAYPQVPADQVVAIAYTSGSTGSPQPTPKTWASFHASTAGNLAMLHAALDGAPAILRPHCARYSVPPKPACSPAGAPRSARSGNCIPA